MVTQKILKVNLTKDSYEIVKASQEELSADKGFHRQISLWLRNFAAQEQIHQGNKDVFNRLTDLDYMRSYFRSGKDKYIIKYTRKVGDEFMSATMELTKAEKYRTDNELIYLYVNTD